MGGGGSMGLTLFWSVRVGFTRESACRLVLGLDLAVHRDQNEAPWVETYRLRGGNIIMRS